MLKLYLGRYQSTIHNIHQFNLIACHSKIIGIKKTIFI